MDAKTWLRIAAPSSRANGNGLSTLFAYGLCAAWRYAVADQIAIPPSTPTTVDCFKASKNSESNCSYLFCAMSVPKGAAFVDTQAIAITMREFAKLIDIPIWPAATGPLNAKRN